MSRQTIVDAAIKLAEKSGFRKVKRESLATKLGIATGTINYHFGTMAKLQDAIVREAIITSNATVLGQALAERHPLALKAPAALRTLAAKSLAA